MANKTRDFAFELKSLKEDGSFDGYGSVFGVKDSYDEIVAAGAFAESLASHKAAGTMPALLWQHRSGEPCGVMKIARALLATGICIDSVRGFGRHKGDKRRRELCEGGGDAVRVMASRRGRDGADTGDGVSAGVAR